MFRMLGGVLGYDKGIPTGGGIGGMSGGNVSGLLPNQGLPTDLALNRLDKNPEIS